MKKILNLTRRSLLVLLITPLLNFAYGQTVITGKITSAIDGSTLPGVGIQIKGTSSGTITNTDGEYSLEVSSENDTLVFSFIGFLSEEVTVDGQTVIDVSLVTDIAQIDEIVVVGYGTQKRVNLTGAVSTVNSDDLEKRPVQNAAQSLQGQVPGLNILQSRGTPGEEGLQMNIRGYNSYSSNNNPLVLIDGVPGNIADIDPTIIETVSVLKDASSAAIYGIQGANGVILINTKQGAKDKINITYDGSYSSHSATSLPEMETNSANFMELYNQAVENSSWAGGNTPYPQDIIDAYRNANGDPLYPNTDWASLVMNDKGSVWKHSVGVNGTAGKTSFNFAVNSWDQDGMMRETWYKKKNFFLNLKTEVNDRVTIGASIMGLHGQRKGPSGNWNDALWSAWKVRPTWGPYTADGTGHYTAKAFSGSANETEFPGFDEGFTRENPLIYVETYEGEKNTSHNFNGNAFLDLKIIEGLIWSTKIAYKYDSRLYRNQQYPVKEYNFRTGEYLREYGGRFNGNEQSTFTNTLYNLYSTLTYSKSFGKHNLKVLAGHSRENYVYNEQISRRYGVINTSITDLDGTGAANPIADGYTKESSLLGYFGRFNYNFAERYLLEVNYRLDQSSRFHPDYRSSTFPSFSVGWRINQEPFMQNISFLDQLKVRASWGQMGNTGDHFYPYQATLAAGEYEGVYEGPGPLRYVFQQGDITDGYSLGKIANKRISWEETTISDIGLDFSVNNGLIHGSVDYFDKTTSGMVRTEVVPIEVGIEGPEINDGEMRNSGWDILIGHRNKIGEFSYGIRANLGIYKNEILSYGDVDREVQGRFINEKGYPFNDWYMYKSNGLYRTVEELDSAPRQPNGGARLGGIRLVDVAGPADADGNPTGSDGRITEADKVHIDGRHPKFNYGINLNAEYKGFDLSVFAMGVQGVKLYYQGMGVEAFVQDGGVPKVWATEAWTPENPNAELPILSYYTGQNDAANSMVNDFWLRDASYFRIKNITLGYSLPMRLLENTFIERFRIYFSGDNLFTIHDDIFNLDPEKAPGAGTIASVYPQYKSYTFGLNITF